MPATIVTILLFHLYDIHRGDWKTRNAGTTRISRNSIIFANLVTCAILALQATTV